MNPGTGTGTGTGTNACVGGSAATTGGVDAGVGGSGVPGVTTGTTGGGGTSGVGGDPSVCVQGVPPTSQVPRLLNREYDNVVRDLLGVTTLAGNGNSAPSALLNDDFTGPMNAYAWDAYQNAAAQDAAQQAAPAAAETCPARRV